MELNDPIPARVLAIAVGQPLRPVWRNELGGLTYQIGTGSYVKWAAYAAWPQLPPSAQNGSATSGQRLRRLNLGVIAGASVPISRQVDVAIVRPTVAPAGTGIAAAVPGLPMENHTPPPPDGRHLRHHGGGDRHDRPDTRDEPGRDLHLRHTSTLDPPLEFVEELICPIGTANGLAFVNFTNTLPAGRKSGSTSRSKSETRASTSPRRRILETCAAEHGWMVGEWLSFFPPH